MSRNHLIDVIACAFAALVVVLFVIALAISNVPEDLSKGLIIGGFSAIVIFGTLLQLFRTGRNVVAFWLILIVALAVHLTIFALLGQTVRPAWLILIAPLEFAALSQLVRNPST